MSEPAIARLIGEGVEKPEASLPLDINYAKLAEWLVTRQKIPKDWHKRLQVIQAKSAEALRDVAPDVLKASGDGPDAPLDYLKAVEVRDQLASTSDRTVFGGLTGPAATWDKIVKAYEKQYVFLGECAQTLAQSVDYDIPYLRKQAAKLNQQILDCDRRHAECLRNAAACAVKYKEECKKLGIQGVAVRQELRALASELPAMLRGVVDSLHDPRLQAAGTYYAAFTRFAHAPRGGQRTGPGAAPLPVLQPEEMLPTLFEIRERRVQPPSTAPAAEESTPTGAAGCSEVMEVDWDLGGDAGASAREASAVPVLDIDWDVGLAGDTATVADGGGGGDAGSGGDTAAVGINWDIDAGDAGLASGGDAAVEAAAAAPPTIDWDIELDAAGEAIDANNLAGDGADGGEARTAAGPGPACGAGLAADANPDDVAAARLERDGDYRAQLMDDLQELRAFLSQRKADLAGSGSELLTTAMPDSVSSVDGAAVGSMLAAVQAVLGQLTAPRFRQLLLIATSQRYLDRLEASLKRQAGAEAKLQRAAVDVAARKQESQSQLMSLAPRVAALVERSRRLKGLAERSVSAALGGKRTINILGEINNVLAAQ